MSRQCQHRPEGKRGQKLGRGQSQVTDSFKNDYERSLTFGTRAFQYIKHNETPAIPRNYDFWFTFVTGLNKELNAAVRQALSHKKRLSPEEVSKLYEAHLAPDHMSERVEEVGGQISEELDEIIALVTNASNRTGRFGRSLETVSGELENVSSARQLKLVVSTLVNATNEMAKSSRDLEDNLAESRRQIGELKQCLETVRNESMTDQLTGIANRKKFSQTIERELAEAVEYNEELCIALADIDFFKRFNDTYGHQTGDQVLRLVAHTLKTNIKGRDLVARYGGEEFALILPKTSLDAAMKLCEQIRAAVQSRELMKRSTGEKLGRVTISLGVALYHRGESIDSLIHRADACLYAAKRAGRNQVKTETDSDIDLNINAA